MARKYFYLFAPIILLLGCGADQNFDDYQRSKVAAQVAQIEKVRGTYEGELISESSRSSLGNLRFELDASTVIEPSSDQTKTSQLVVLKGVLNVSGSKTVYLSFSGGFYDANTGKFQALVPVARRNSEVVTLDISGLINSSGMRGRIEAVGYPEDRANFDLIRTESRASSQVKAATDPKVFPAELPLKVWRAEIENKKDDWYEILFMPHQITKDEEFLELFVSVRLIDVVVRVGDVTSFLHPNARWDSRNGTLKGEGSFGVVNSGSYTTLLNCIAIALDQQELGFNCQHITGFTGRFTELRFLPKKDHSVTK